MEAKATDINIKRLPQVTDARRGETMKRPCRQFLDQQWFEDEQGRLKRVSGPDRALLNFENTADSKLNPTTPEDKRRNDPKKGINVFSVLSGCGAGNVALKKSDIKVNMVISFEYSYKARMVMEANHNKDDFELIHGWRGKHNVEELTLKDIQDMFAECVHES